MPLHSRRPLKASCAGEGLRIDRAWVVAAGTAATAADLLESVHLVYNCDVTVLASVAHRSVHIYPEITNV